MTVGHTHEDRQDTPAPLPPGPEMMLGLWASWVESASKLAGSQVASDPATQGSSFWQVSPDQMAGSLLGGGVRQLGETLSHDPILRAIEEAFNANPLREVVPVDWAEIVRALRTVWLRSLNRPDKAVAAVVDFNARLWQSAVDIWNEAGQRWLGMAQPDAPTTPPGAADKRFAAPEEVASLVAYIASPLASATTGAALRVDGGVIRSAF